MRFADFQLYLLHMVYLFCLQLVKSFWSIAIVIQEYCILIQVYLEVGNRYAKYGDDILMSIESVLRYQSKHEE